MQIRISYHGMDPSEALAEFIHLRAAQLEHLSDRIHSLRVVVDAPHQSHRHGNRYAVRLEIREPRDKVVVGSDGNDAATSEDVYQAIRRAFDTARRQLHTARTLRTGRQRAHNDTRRSIRLGR